MTSKHALRLACGVAALSAQAALAQQAAPADALPVDRIVVTASPFHRPGDEVTSNVAVLGGDDLAHRREGSLGETLDGIPGVNSDTFGGGASRPVVRGQTAPRVKVLSDGAALMDASEISPDHAIGTEPLLLDRIEILRGPSALLYGGGAIGGAVNLIDRKIATSPPERGGEAALETRLGTADDEEAAVAGLSMNLLPGAASRATGLVLRAEAATRKTDDYDVPGFAEPRVGGTFNTMTTGAAGLSFVGPRGYFGAAYSGQEGAYGIPGHSHEYEDCHPHGASLHCGGHGDDGDDHDHDDEDEHGEEHGGAGGDRADVPVVDLNSRRFDVRGQLVNPLPGIEVVRMRGGFSDYLHQEIDEGVVGTTFTNEGYDARAEAQHAPLGGLRGVAGVQHSRSDFAALGTESFVPETRTDSTAIFLFEEYTIGDVRLEGALRQEWQNIQGWGVRNGAAFTVPATSHDPFSVSGAAIWSFMPDWSAAVSLARSQRAPNAQELFARGIHLATNTYELGDATLEEETANSVELTLRKTSGATTFSASAFRYGYDGYIFADTLDRFEDFRLIRYSQADATFTGIEGEARHQIGDVGLSVFGDMVRAKLDGGGGDLPRIPAARLGGRADVTLGAWFGEIEYARVFEQDDIAAFETVTPGYDMVNATLSYALEAGPAAAEIFLRGTNLLDEPALNHASFLADVAPLRGRNVVLGLRASF